LCRSRDRERKDHAIYERFFKRIEKKLTKLAESVAKGRMKKPSQIERRIGDLLGKNSRAAKSFEVELKNEDGQLRLEGTSGRIGKSGRSSAKDVICFGPTLWGGIPPGSGRRISNSWMPKPPFGP
jgi:hypothetical protein